MLQSASLCATDHLLIVDLDLVIAVCAVQDFWHARTQTAIAARNSLGTQAETKVKASFELVSHHLSYAICVAGVGCGRWGVRVSRELERWVPNWISCWEDWHSEWSIILRVSIYISVERLLEDWERVDEVNLLSILVHINPCKFYSYQPFLYRIHSCFAMSTFFPSSQCFFLSSHVYNAGLDWYTIIRSADAMLWVYRTVWETKTYSHRHRHNPSRAHRKLDIKKIIVGSFFYSLSL